MGLLHFIAVIAHAQVRMDGLTLSDLSDLSDAVTTITFDMKQITQQITTRGNATVALDKVGANARRMVDLSVLADCWRETVGFVWPAALPMFNRAWNTWLAVSAAIINARAEHVEAHAAAHLVSLDGMCVMAVHIDIHATVAALPIAQWACCNRCCRRIVAASSSALL